MMIKTLLLMLFIFTFSFSVKAESQGKIIALQGAVKIFQEGKEKTSAALGETVASNDTLITGPRSYCVVELDPDNTFRVKQNTEIKIKKLKTESLSSAGKVVSEYRLDLMSGTLSAKLNKLPPDSKFEIFSPVAIAGAAGTVYTVETDPENKNTSISVLDHSVLVQSLNEPKKSVKIQKFEEVLAAPWSSAMIKAEGRGALSEAILGKSFIKEAEQKIEISNLGEGLSLEEARTQSLYQLSKIICRARVISNLTNLRINRCLSSFAFSWHI